MPTNYRYVGLNPSQMNYGKKNLLYSEMEILNTIKHLKNYKKLRKQEFAAKNLLKKSLTQLKIEVQNLNELLPSAALNKDEFNISTSSKNKNSLEREIQDLQQKIAELQ
jgi:hypothetical protein